MVVNALSALTKTEAESATGIAAGGDRRPESVERDLFTGSELIVGWRDLGEHMEPMYRSALGGNGTGFLQIGERWQDLAFEGGNYGTLDEAKEAVLRHAQDD